VSVDEVVYQGDEITRLDLRYEHRCLDAPNQGSSWGALRYDVDDVPAPLSPKPIPPDFWTPAPGTLPTGDTGSYLYVESQAGDWVGGGGSWLYEAPAASFSRQAATTHVSQTGRPSWNIEARPRVYDAPLEVGYYERAAPWGSVSGWFSATGNGHGGCNALGWYVVDDVAYDNGALTLLHLRFEQRCHATDPPLRGVLHWEAADP
jgi:hypothetical protein